MPVTPLLALWVDYQIKCQGIATGFAAGSERRMTLCVPEESKLGKVAPLWLVTSRKQ